MNKKPSGKWTPTLVAVFSTCSFIMLVTLPLMPLPYAIPFGVFWAVITFSGFINYRYHRAHRND